VRTRRGARKGKTAQFVNDPNLAYFHVLRNKFVQQPRLTQSERDELIETTALQENSTKTVPTADYAIYSAPVRLAVEFEVDDLIFKPGAVRVASVD
jgi:hypothetical protein